MPAVPARRAFLFREHSRSTQVCTWRSESGPDRSETTKPAAKRSHSTVQQRAIRSNTAAPAHAGLLCALGHARGNTHGRSVQRAFWHRRARPSGNPGVICTSGARRGGVHKRPRGHAAARIPSFRAPSAPNFDQRRIPCRTRALDSTRVASQGHGGSRTVVTQWACRGVTGRTAVTQLNMTRARRSSEPPGAPPGVKHVRRSGGVEAEELSGAAAAAVEAAAAPTAAAVLYGQPPEAAGDAAAVRMPSVSGCRARSDRAWDSSSPLLLGATRGEKAAESRGCVASNVSSLPLELLQEVLARAGAWVPRRGGRGATKVSAMSVCRTWRDALRDHPTVMAKLLLHASPPGRRSGRQGYGAEVGASGWVRVARAGREDILSVMLRMLGKPAGSGPACSAPAASAAASSTAAVYSTAGAKRLCTRAARARRVAEAALQAQLDAALNAAAKGGHTGCVRALLYGPPGRPAAHADSSNSAALCGAAGKGRTDIVEMLLNAPSHAAHADSPNNSALIEAACSGQAAIVEMLLNAPSHAAHADAWNSTGLVGAARYGHSVVVRLLLNAPSHTAHAGACCSKALLAAAERGHEDIVEMLLDTPARADAWDSKALVYAARKGLSSAARELLHAPLHAAHADCRNNQALLSAAWRGHTDIVKMLVNAHWHPACADHDDGRALVEAAIHGHAGVVEALLSAPACAARADCCDSEALYNAARNGHGCVVEMLLKVPVHAAQPDCRGGAAFTQAAIWGHSAVFSLLRGAELRGTVSRARAARWEALRRDVRLARKQRNRPGAGVADVVVLGSRRGMRTALVPFMYGNVLLRECDALNAAGTDTDIVSESDSGHGFSNPDTDEDGGSGASLSEDETEENSSRSDSGDSLSEAGMDEDKSSRSSSGGVLTEAASDEDDGSGPDSGVSLSKVGMHNRYAWIWQQERPQHRRAKGCT
eukprot:366433-Chlamydomonas_euryale.AAC.7